MTNSQFNNPPAFPGASALQTGMTLRDWFAGQVLAADGDAVVEYRSHSEMAERAYAIADAMLLARKGTDQ